jgi:hypothetical protein
MKYVHTQNQSVAKATRLNLILRTGYSPVAVEFKNPTVYHRIGSNHHAIVLADDRHSATLLFQEGCSDERVRRTARRLTAPGRRDVRLQDPIVAMQVVEPGESWPADYLAGSTSRFVTAPLKADGARKDLGDVASTHPLLHQPAGTMWVMGGRNDDLHPEGPLTLPHRSIVQIEQRGKRLLVSIRNHNVAQMLIGLTSEELATGLKADLEAGRVRLLRYGGVINELVLFPNSKPDSRGERGYGCFEVGAADGGLAADLSVYAGLADPKEVAAELARRWSC